MFRRARLVAVVTAVAAVSLAGCSSSDSSGDKDAASSPKAVVKSSAPAHASSPTSPTAPQAEADVQIVKAGVENHPVWGPHAYVVHYSVTNHGAGAADYFAQLEFLDADGDHLGSTGITADKLGPGKSKTGDAAPLEVEVENGKIADIRSVRVSQVDRTPSS